MKSRRKLTIFGGLLFLTSFIYIIQYADDGTSDITGYKHRLLPVDDPDNSGHTNELINIICEDCAKKDNLLSQWPNTKPKGVIYILTQQKRFKNLIELLISISKHFNELYKYPVVIFYEEMDLASKLTVRNISQTDVLFQKVQFNIPPFLNGVQDNIKCTSSIGYRHMCRFHVKGVYEQGILQGFDYHWRLDDDSLLTRRVHYDVFKHMQSHDYLYGYIWIHVDSHLCTKGLWEATEQYILDRNIQTQYFSNWASPKIFYNNFEVSSSKLWRSDTFRDFIEYIDRLGGIYYHRWGDAPIKGLAVSMFVPENRTHHFKDIGYRHGTFNT